MGLLDRLLGKPDLAKQRPVAFPPRSAPVKTAVASLLTGDDELEVVGESNYQPELWAACGGRVGDRIRHSVVAVLVPEPQNAHDANAIAIQINGSTVGYFPRNTAAEYRPGLLKLMEQNGGYIALEGVVVGGGSYEDGPGRLGLWLRHDPRDFGLERGTGGRQVGAAAKPGSAAVSMRTGFTEAGVTDVEDDSYDLSWYDDLPEPDRPAIAMLRELLERDRDPIARHFQFAELERRLYRCRDLYDSALQEFDLACQLHDGEMETICEAFRTKWGKVPVLETYRQMAIRQQKKQDWQSCLWWADRGLALYGASPAREEAVEDLLKRRNRALAKLGHTRTRAAGADPGTKAMPSSADSSDRPVSASAESSGESEVLPCGRCGASFERLRARGRKPQLCPDCRPS